MEGRFGNTATFQSAPRREVRKWKAEQLLRGTGDVYVQTIEQSVLAAVNSRTSAVLGDWMMPDGGLGLKGRNLKGLNVIRRSRFVRSL
jgi:hypothetical protein